MRARTLFGISALITSLSSPAFAWGERGHDAVARVATRVLAESDDTDAQKLGAFLQRKENMIGHLANVPDIVWRSFGKDIDALSAPSHFIDLEYFVGPGRPPKAEDMPADIRALLAAMAKNCSRAKEAQCVPGKSDDEKLATVGHAPFRVQTLTEDLRDTFKAIKALETKAAQEEKGKDGQHKDRDKQGDDPRTLLMHKAILYSGILAHFVGDLANPHHTAVDYDGWHSDQGGLHGYFESEMVDSYPLDFEAVVLDEAERHPAMAEKFAKHPHNYLQQAWELALDSHTHLDELIALDKTYSLLEKSVSGDRDNRKRAKRKDVKDVRSHYRNFIILRLASGADALSRLWLDAWKEGGKPDLGFYRSYYYDVKPDLIPLRYLPGRQK